MKKIKQWILIISVLIITLFCVFVANNNFHPVQFNLLNDSAIKLPLIAVLAISFASGLIISWLVYALLVFKQGLKIKRLNKELSDLKQEVSQLRKSPMGGYH